MTEPATPRERLSPALWPPFTFLAINAVVVVALLGLVLNYGGAHWPLQLKTYPLSFERFMPLWVPWAGALGGAIISLEGIVRHTTDWDGRRFAYWHLSRPLLGGVSGTVGVLIVLFVLKSIAPESLPGTQGGTGGAAGQAIAGYGPSGTAVMMVIAFVIGYREETFRTLIKRVADVILAPGDGGGEAAVAFVPSVVRMQGSAATGPVPVTVHLFNGSKDTLTVGNSALAFAPAAGLSATVANEDSLEPLQSKEITLTWDPAQAPPPVESTLTARVGGHTLTMKVICTAP